MTPLVDASALMDGLWLKIEYENPSLSIKHRAIPRQIDDWHASGVIGRESRLVILTAGCAGISVAYAAQNIGCNATLLVENGVASGIVNYARFLGADVQMEDHGSLGTALDAYRGAANCHVIEQLTDPSFIAHYEAIGHELIQQHSGVSAVVAGAGTTASLMGIASVVRNEGIEVFAVEPGEAPVLSGETWQPHAIQGLAPPVPTKLFDPAKVDGIMTVPSRQAWDEARHTLKIMDRPVGTSSGAAIAGARRLRADGYPGDIVAICSSHIITCL